MIMCLMMMFPCCKDLRYWSPEFVDSVLHAGGQLEKLRGYTGGPAYVV